MDLETQGMIEYIFPDLYIIQQFSVLKSILGSQYGSGYRKIAALAFSLMFLFCPQKIYLTLLDIRHFQVSIVPGPL